MTILPWWSSTSSEATSSTTSAAHKGKTSSSSSSASHAEAAEQLGHDGHGIILTSAASAGDVHALLLHGQLPTSEKRILLA
jgi:citrate synthase